MEDDKLLIELKDIGLTLNEAAELTDKELRRRYSFEHYWVYRLRTVQIAAGIETPIVNRERFFRQAQEKGLRTDVSNALANASLSVEKAAQMSDAELGHVEGLGRCGLWVLRGKQVDLKMESFHITMYKLSRTALDLRIGQRSVDWLRQEKLTLEDTSKLTDAELSKFSGVGRKTIGDIRQLEIALLPDLWH